MAKQFSRRNVVGGGFAASALLAVPASVRGDGWGASRSAAAETRPGAVSVLGYRDRDAATDTEAFARAIASGNPIHVPAGGGTGAGGDYLVDTGHLPNLVSGAMLFGDGIGQSVIRKAGKGYLFYANSGSADVRRNLTSILFEDLSLVDDVVRLGFDEHNHLISLNGVTGAAFHRVEFKGFRGDGAYIGSGIVRGHERHNRDLAFRNCRFDGINSNNRNGISIIDGDGIIIDQCEFVNTTRRGDGSRKAGDRFDPNTGLGMPGSIDCEPDDHGFAIIRNVQITGCRFSGGGGNAISLLLRPNNKVDVPHSGFVVRDNVIRNRAGGFGFNGFRGHDAAGPNPGYDVLLEGNRIEQCEVPFNINGARGLTFRANRMTDCAKPAELGYSDYNCEVAVLDNDFVRIGYAPVGGNGLLVRFADKVAVERNRFVDCGRADGISGRAIYFVAGDIKRFRLIGNRFESPAGRTTYAIGVAPSASIDRGTSVARGNVFTFVTNRDFG